MSSIAYVTDNNMIEFHRVMGNKQLVFWRISSTLRFSDFHSGDLLFFLAKGTEKSKGDREKGIIGYGQFTKGEVLTPQIAWRRYKTLNGYATKEEFYETLTKVEKNKQLPEQISCLHLSNVVFFQAPIYLSELGINISNKVESYVYLDKEEDTTLRILEKAKEVGIDAWSLSLSDEEDESFERTQQREIIARVSEFLKSKEISKEKSINRFMLKALAQLEKEYTEIDFIKRSTIEAYQISDDRISIFVPVLYSTKNKMQVIQYCVGKLLAYRSLLEMDPYIEMDIELVALFQEELEEGLVDMLEGCGVVCRCISESVNG